MLKAVNDIRDYWHVVRSQCYVNLRITVVTTRLGLLWWVLDPLIFMVIYYFVVSIVFNRGGPNYHLFALCGIVTWQSFARSISLSTSSLVRSAGLIKQASIPMFLFVIIPPVVQAFFYLIGLLIILLWNWGVVGLHTLAIVVLVILMPLMACAAGMFCSVCHVYVRDTEKLVSYILRFGFFMSPVLYAPDRIYDNPSIPDLAKNLYALNPMVHYITAVRDLFLYGRMFDIKAVCLLFAVTILVLQLGLWFFRNKSLYVPKMI
jgi:lipopolysaccharide transport system permease protein